MNAASNVDRPNIILYISDDQSIWDYGCYGHPKVHTPAVDRLAREGMRFTRTYTAQAICAPSRSVLFSGNFPIRNGVYMNHLPYRPEQRSLLPELQDLGYQVILAGKGHIGPDEAFPWNQRWPLEKTKLKETGQPYRLPLDQIDQFIRRESGPYCLVLASALPHVPFPVMQNVNADHLIYHPHYGQRTDAMDQHLAGYYENIRRENAQLEVIFDAVDRSPRPENTISLYTTDHGSLNGKYTVYDSGLNMPMLIRWPDRIQRKTVCSSLISFADIWPTLIECAGGEPPDEIDGRSFRSLLDEPSQPHREFTFGVAEHQNILAPRVFPSRMATDGQWKYVRNYNAMSVHENNFGNREAVNAFIRLGAESQPNAQPEELYDLDNDPFEQNNLIEDSANASTKDRLAQAMHDWMQQQGDYLVEGGPLPLFKPTVGILDQPNEHHTPPQPLIGTLRDADYRLP